MSKGRLITLFSLLLCQCQAICGLNPTSIPGAETLPVSQRKCKEYSDVIEKCEDQTNPLAADYESVNPKEFPHIAQVAVASPTEVNWICLGTLISDEYILTAAHCAEAKISKNTSKYVRLGDLDNESENDDAKPEIFNVTEIILHPDYDSAKLRNDIALLRLNRKVKFSSYIRPACLPTTSHESDTEGIISGWGKTIESGNKIPSRMLKFAMNKIGFVKCLRQNEIFFHLLDDESKQFCAEPKFVDKAFILGHGGGSFQINHPSLKCMYTTIGIVSFSINSDSTEIYPTVLTRVFPHIDWIQEIVWKND